MNIEYFAFWEKIWARCGHMNFNSVDGQLIVVSFVGGNVIFSQALIEDLDYNLEDVERLPDNAIRLGQYRLEPVATYPRFEVVEFKVISLPVEDVPQSYWQRLARYMNMKAQV